MAAVADRIRGRLGREGRAQPALAGGFAHDFPRQHHTVRAREPRRRPIGHLVLRHAVFGLEGLETEIGVDQGRHAEIGERRDPAHGIQREGRRPTEFLPDQPELVLVRDMQIEPRFRLQICQRRGQEAPRTAFPGAAVGVEAVAQDQVEGRVFGLQHQPSPRRVIGYLPHLVHRPPRVVGDVLERRQRLPGQRPAEAVGLAALVFRSRYAARPGKPDEVVPDQKD